MNVALAHVDTMQATEPLSAMVTIAPTTADVALKQTIHALRNERAVAALKFVIASFCALAASIGAWTFLPVPLLFVYLAIDQWVLAHREIRNITKIRARVVAGEPLGLQGLSLLVGEHASHQPVTLRRSTMRSLANRAISAAPLATALKVGDHHNVSALVAEQTLAPLLRTQTRVRAALFAAGILVAIGAMATGAVGAIVAGIIPTFLLFSGAVLATRRLGKGTRAMTLLNEGGFAVIAAENLVVQRGDVQAAFALKPSSLRLLMRNDLPQARIMLRKPSQ
jgi:hypothetical protein